MKLGYALLADAAQVTPDGKLSMLGGDFDTIFVRSFPAQHSSLALVVKLDAARDDCGREHEMRVTSSGPLNSSFLPAVESRFTPQLNPLFANRPTRVLLVFNFQSLMFPNQGKYQFHITVDGTQLGTVPLELTRIPQPEIRARD